MTLNELSLIDADFYYLLDSLDSELSSKYSILFHRLLHPSGMVKERTCTSISKLLTHDDFSTTCTSLIIKWINSQKIEIQAVYGLLAIIKAKLFTDSYDTSGLLTNLEKMIAPSQLIIELCKEIDPTSEPPQFSTPLCSKSYPESYEINDFFQQYEPQFVSPSLRQLILSNKEFDKMRLIKQWSYESDLIISDLNYIPNSEILWHRGRLDLEYIGSFNSILSDIYTSAFLRAISWAKSEGLSQEYARKMTLSTCPIDLGLWKINPSQRPVYWPKIEKTKESIIETLWTQISDIWKEQLKNNWILGFIEGRMGENGSFFDLSVNAFLGETGVDKKYREGEIFSFLDTQYIPRQELSLRCEGEIHHIENKNKKSHQGSDIIPLSSIFLPSIFAHWQFWRQHRLIHFPSVNLITPPTKYVCSSDGIHFIEQDERFAKWNDWTDGITEERKSNLSLRTGNKLEILSDKLNRLNETKNFNYGWACKITEYSRNGYQGRYKSSRYYKIFV